VNDSGFLCLGMGMRIVRKRRKCGLARLLSLFGTCDRPNDSERGNQGSVRDHVCVY
jgi:hypothetical protein